MTDNDKIRLANLVLEFIDNHENTDKKLIPRQVGVLNREVAYKGFKPAEVGTPVFDMGSNKLMFVVETLDGKHHVECVYERENTSTIPGMTTSITTIVDFI